MPKLKNIEDEMFCKNVAKFKDPAIALQKLYPSYSKNSASAVARTKILNSREIRDRISEILDTQHISLIDLNNVLKRQLNAKKPLLNNGVVEMYDDNIAQLNAMDKGYKLHGLLRNDAPQIDVRSISVSIDSTSIDKLGSILAELKQLNQQDNIVCVNPFTQPIDIEADTTQ